MTERSKSEIEAKSAAIRDAGAGALASGGLAAAFGAASCCALPALLGSFGLGSAWLGSLAVAAGPHRAVLLAVAVSFLSAAPWSSGDDDVLHVWKAPPASGDVQV